MTKDSGADSEGVFRRSAYVPRFEGERWKPTRPIPGTNRVKYVEENVASVDLTLTADDLAALEAAVPRDAVVGARYGNMSHIDA